ncbi:unnamed protein product (macronuclear) [Paramecium tetraurelia]|uniref:Serine aminopeptidase S33 domain-containing protein n=1 Tax=Paramecium tetraurelia TaxID=5888 RepID=A0D4F3_PARTE|nr:uncharacterized protein GSPATT00013386001 [Paramecium tetraurelia]CAK77920.1 unnamed protein product [Paramecium tetraurelia]|eukprot:XP_001445317.1 hypothetical protein (macronuclear) [Paramecium tetraurelia strain d4-2]
MYIFIFFALAYAQIECNKDDLVTTCSLNSFSAYMVTYEKKTSDTMFLFIGAKPGQSALFFDQLGVGPNSTYEKWTDLGHLMFLDIQGSGYTIITKTPKSIAEYTQQYVNAFNTFKEELDYKFTRLYIVTSGIGSKVALELALQLQAYGTILFSPLLNLLENMRQLPTTAYHMGLIDFQERQSLELQIISLSQPKYSDYQILVNKVSKMSGDMQVSDFRKYEMDNSTILLTDIMNTQEVRDKYHAKQQFFKTFNIDVFNNMTDSLSQNIDLDKYLKLTKIICLIPQFSLSTNIQGTLSYLLQFKQFNELPFVQYVNEHKYAIYVNIGTIYIIYNSGDKIYQDQQEIVKNIIKKL